MARLVRPISFDIRPANKGMNVSRTPQEINLKETPRTVNCRFNRGQILSRVGFKLKYKGCREAPLWIDVVYSGTSEELIVLTRKNIYYENSGQLEDVDIYDGDGNQESTPIFSMDPSTNYVSIDVGDGTVHFNPDSLGGSWANNGNLFPNSGVATLGVLTNGADGILVLAYTGQGTGVEGQFLHDDWALGAPTSAACVAIFDGRLVVGDVNGQRTVVAWSSKGRIDHWDTGTYADTGNQVLGDSPDAIMTMMRLGEYLAVYRERSIWLGRRTFINDPALIFEPAPGTGVGIASPQSIGDLGKEHFFLGWDDVYVFSLAGLEPIGTRIKEELFYGTHGILPEYIRNCQGAIAEEFDEYWLFIPTGRWPKDEDASGSPSEAVINRVANPDFGLGTLDLTPTDWSVSGTGATLAKKSGGNFGGYVGRLSTGSATGEAVSAQYDYDEVIDGDTFSVLVKLKVQDGSGSVDVNAKFDTYDSAGGNAVSHTGPSTSIADDGEYHTVIFSSVVSDADAEQIAAIVRMTSQNRIVDIDCVQLIRMDGIPIEYWYGTAGEQAPGYLGPDGDDPVLIPFINDLVGQWFPDTVWVYNYEADAWTSWYMPMTGFGYDLISGVITIADLTGTISEQRWRYDDKRIDALAATDLIGQPDGQVYEVSAEYTKDFEGIEDRAILAYWESKDFDLERPNLDKTFSRLVIYHETTHPPSTITVGVSTDSGVTWNEQDITIREGYTQSFADFFVTGNQVRFRIKSSEGFYISGFSVKLIARGESYAF